MSNKTLFSSFWSIANHVGHSRIFTKYTGVELPNRKRFKCIIHNSKDNDATILGNGNYYCFSSNCVANKGLDLPELIATVVGRPMVDVVKDVVNDYKDQDIKPTKKPVIAKVEVKVSEPPYYGLNQNDHHILGMYWKLINEEFNPERIRSWAISRNLDFDRCIKYGVRHSSLNVLLHLKDRFSFDSLKRVGLSSAWLAQSDSVLIPVWVMLDHPVGFRIRKLNYIDGVKEKDMTGRNVDHGTQLPPMGIQSLHKGSGKRVLVIVEGTIDYLTACEALDGNDFVSVIGINKVKSRLPKWLLGEISQYSAVVDLTHVKDGCEAGKYSDILYQVKELGADQMLFRKGLLEQNDLNDMHKRNEAVDFLRTGINRIMGRIT